MAVTRLAACVLAGLLAAPAPSLGAPPASTPAAQALVLGKRGDALFKASRYEEALAQYEEAWRLSPAPVLLWNRARCREELGRLDEALTLFEEVALSDAPKARRRAAARRAKDLRDRIAAQQAQVTPPEASTSPAETGPTIPAPVEPVTTVVTPAVPVPAPLPEPPGTVIRTNGLMLIPVSPIVEVELRLADHWALELGLAFGMPVNGRELGLGGLVGARWYPLQVAPDGWFVELAVLAGGEPSRSAAETAGGLVGLATGYQYVAWETLVLGIGAGPGILATADGVIFFPVLRTDVGVAF